MTMAAPRFVRRLSAWVFLAAALSGCASLSAPERRPLTPGPIRGEVTPINVPNLEMYRGQPVLLYVSDSNQLVLRSPDGIPKVIGEESPRGAALTMPRLLVDGGDLHAFWRPKLQRPVDGVGGAGDKLVYTRVSRDGGQTFERTTRLNVAGGAFLSGAAGNGRGDLYAYWVDERGGRAYDLYVNVSRDGGRTWQKTDTRLDPGRAGVDMSLDPTMAVEGGQAWIAWQERTPDGTIFYLRATRDRGVSWGEPVVMDRTHHSATGLHLVRLPAARGGRLVLYWFHQFGVSGVVSDDEGRTWKSFAPLSAPDLFEFNELKVVQDPTGKVIMVVGDQPAQKRQDLHVAVSDDGVNFSRPVRLDSDSRHESNSRFADIATDGAGRILIVWHDLRAFRPRLYARYSGDGGVTWGPQETEVDTGGVIESMMPRVRADGSGGFHLTWIGYPDHRRAVGSIYASTVNPATGAGLARAPNVPDAERLRARVARFWEARKRADWYDNFDLLDPFFRVGVNRDQFVVNQLKTVYHDYEIRDVNLSGNSAKVTVRYSAEVPELMLKSGQHVSIARHDADSTEEWIWADGDWYRVAKDAMGQDFVPR